MDALLPPSRPCNTPGSLALLRAPWLAAAQPLHVLSIRTGWSACPAHARKRVAASKCGRFTPTRTPHPNPNPGLGPPAPPHPPPAEPPCSHPPHAPTHALHSPLPSLIAYNHAHGSRPANSSLPFPGHSRSASFPNSRRAPPCTMPHPHPHPQPASCLPPLLPAGPELCAVLESWRGHLGGQGRGLRHPKAGWRVRPGGRTMPARPPGLCGLRRTRDCTVVCVTS